MRIPQKINFMPTSSMGSYKMTNKHSVLEKYFTVYKNQLFYKGFIYKPFTFKQLDTSASIKPTHEELLNFQQGLNRGGANGGESSDDENSVAEMIKRTIFQGGQNAYAKGDKIEVIKGDLTGLKGTVIAIEEGSQVTFKAIGIPQLDKPL